MRNLSTTKHLVNLDQSHQLSKALFRYFWGDILRYCLFSHEVKLNFYPLLEDASVLLHLYPFPIPHSRLPNRPISNLHSPVSEQTPTFVVPI